MGLILGYVTTDRRCRSYSVLQESTTYTGGLKDQTITKQNSVWMEAVRIVPTRPLGFIRDPRCLESRILMFRSVPRSDLAIYHRGYTVSKELLTQNKIRPRGIDPKVGRVRERRDQSVERLDVVPSLFVTAQWYDADQTCPFYPIRCVKLV